MRFIPTRVHGVLDYAMGVLLIAAPWILGFADADFAANGAETWIMVLFGGTMIVASLMTAYECGVVNVISMSTHLGLDVLMGLVLAASPWLFGFADQVYLPHLILGLSEAAAGLMTQTTPTSVPAAGGMRQQTRAR
jgi:hypothetical protein